jgi:hypothetical protein
MRQKAPLEAKQAQPMNRAIYGNLLLVRAPPKWPPEPTYEMRVVRLCESQSDLHRRKLACPIRRPKKWGGNTVKPGALTEFG